MTLGSVLRDPREGCLGVVWNSDRTVGTVGFDVYGGIRNILDNIYSCTCMGGIAKTVDTSYSINLSCLEIILYFTTTICRLAS